MTGRRVLVTGASGFIGSHCLAPLVAAGFDVVAAGRTRPKALPPDAHWIDADLLAPGATERVAREARADTLLHLAWYVEPGKLIDHEDNLRWVEASLALVRHFRAAGGTRCVIGGTCYEYDWRYGYCVEALTPLTPDTVYGAAKGGLCQAVLAHARASGLSAAWGRLFFLYGPHENPSRLVPSVILSLLRGQEARSSHGRQVRDYMHAQDAGEGLVALLASEAQGTYNVASGQGVTIREIVERIGAATGRTDLLRIGALPARPNDVALLVGDVERAAEAFGWRARIDLAGGLASTVAWWQENLNRGQA